MSLVNKMKEMLLSKTVEDYSKLPYTIEIFRDETDGDAGWVARIIEFPGCITQGETIGDLAEMIEDAMRTWIESALADGDPVPGPRPHPHYRYRFRYRFRYCRKYWKSCLYPSSRHRFVPEPGRIRFGRWSAGQYS